MADSKRTFLAFHHDAKLYRLRTRVTEVRPFATLEEANRLLFKQGTDGDHVVVTEKTIFHPQGGGQPSDEGEMTYVEDRVEEGKGSKEEVGLANGTAAAGAGTGVVFTVSAVRMDAVHDGQVLHLGRFINATTADDTNGDTRLSPPPFSAGTLVEQSLDQAKRLLYSRLHTAGHVLGAAVRAVCEADVPGFDELKASHFPDQAACEFAGLIGAQWKAPIQQKVDELVARALPVEVDWWAEEDFRREGLERLIPSGEGLPARAPGEKWRVIKIVGAEVYPCGGTHVDSTDLCSPTTVRKISRSKGTSRVSYSVG